MQRPQFIVAFAAILLCWGVSAPLAGAAALYFQPVTDVTAVSTGDVLVMDVFADFTDESTLGSSFDIEWDTSAVGLVSLDYIPVGEPSFRRPPDVEDGRLVSWAFGAFAGISGLNQLGSVSFEVLEGMGASTSLDFGCSGLQACLFFSSEDFVTQIMVDRPSLEITRVPVPAALWLLLTALAVLPRGRSAALA